jgi:hypothetical protein
VIESPRVLTFLDALEHADEREFCSPPGLHGTWRVRWIRIGLKRGVVAIHSTGAGFTLVQPPTHGCCRECAGHKGAMCEHCSCELCVWLRQTDELASPRVSRDRLVRLAARIKALTFAGPQPARAPALDDDIL